MSNETFIVSLREKKRSRIVVRFFKNTTSDFEAEAAIFKQMGLNGIGPRELETTAEYRVEEYINGRPLTMLELRNPYIAERLMGMICELNYNSSMHELIRSIKKNPNSNHSIDFLRDQEKGWFNRYLKEVRGKLRSS